MKKFVSTGKLVYSDEPLSKPLTPYKLIVEVDPELANFYRNTIPKKFAVNRSKFPPHISVVRKEIPTNIKFWKKYDNKPIEFEYYDYVFNDETYFWLNAYSKELEDIRVELGLTAMSDLTKPPDGSYTFHITITNIK